MRRMLVSLVVAVGLTLGSGIQISAAGGVSIRIDCNDGDSLPLTVDLQTLTALTDSVRAINENPTGLSCTLVQLPVPLTFVRFGSVATAAQSSGYVIGGGRVQAGCPNDSSRLFEGSFAVKMYFRDGTVRGSANLAVPGGQCVEGPSTLSSRSSRRPSAADVPGRTRS
jgi:hypothetical protein